MLLLLLLLLREMQYVSKKMFLINISAYSGRAYLNFFLFEGALIFEKGASSWKGSLIRLFFKNLISGIKNENIILVCLKRIGTVLSLSHSTTISFVYVQVTTLTSWSVRANHVTFIANHVLRGTPPPAPRVKPTSIWKTKAVSQRANVAPSTTSTRTPDVVIFARRNARGVTRRSTALNVSWAIIWRQITDVSEIVLKAPSVLPVKGLSFV